MKMTVSALARAKLLLILYVQICIGHNVTSICLERMDRDKSIKRTTAWSQYIQLKYLNGPIDQILWVR